MIDSGPRPESGTGSVRGDVAIIGMGCLFAGAPDLDTYWQNIIDKVDAISDPPSDDWDPKVFYDPESKSNDRVYCKRGGYIGDLSQFRPLDFGVMPVTVDGGEPDQWLALRVAQEALADAGFTEPPKEHARTEVILGKGTYVNRGNLTVGYHGMIVDYFLQVLRTLHPEYTESEIGEIKKALKTNLPPFSADTAPALIGNIIAGRIANRLDLMGPSFTVDAACASALLAIEIGVRDLLSHKYDLVLAGGANANAPLPIMTLFCQLGALSRREQIRPFDKNADGTILGGGMGMIVLKRREDAERDGNRIYALVKGVGVASDGRAVHVMAPRIEGEELALRRAYEMAGVDPTTVGLIEAHGTATPIGDLVEVQALSRVLGERRGALPTCALGSVKSMIGHTMPAAGIAGVIKAALALYHRVLPPTLNCDEPNPALQLEKTTFHVNTETRPWIHGAGTPRRAGVNSFGFGGINAHAVLEEHPDEKPQSPSHHRRWESEVCIVEADSREALVERAHQLKGYLVRAPEIALRDFAYSLNTQLADRPARLALIAQSKEDLAKKLETALKRLADPRCLQIKDSAGIYFFDRPLQGKLAFLFPGEGAQYPNMLLDLCLHFPEVRRCFDLADRALKQSSRTILPSEFIFPRSILGEAERAIVETALWQIDGAVEGVLSSNWAMWTLLSQLEIRPDLIVGHSTGDYSAMLASKIIDLPDEAYVETILEWNKAHYRLARETPVPEAVLVAVAADSATVMSIVETIGADLYLAMDNCPHQSVLVGSKIAAEQAIEHLRRRGLIYEILPFDRPYHTPMFRPHAQGWGGEFFANLPISTPKTETFSCTTTSHYPADIEEIRQLFVAHWERPVLFTETINKMYDYGARIFVEAGPRGNLTAFVSDILRSKAHLAIPSNLSRRSGLTQLNHLVGLLATQQVRMRLDYLYARRSPKLVPWEDARPATPVKPKPAPMKVSLALPRLEVSGWQRKPSSPEAVTAPFAGNELVRDMPPHLSGEHATRKGKLVSQHSDGAPESPARQITHTAFRARPEAVPAPASAGASAAVMDGYFKGMQEYLEVQTQVMGAFLNRSRTTDASNRGATRPAAREFPLLGTITSIVPGEELIAVRQLTHEEDLFLSDHALGAEVSLTDPALKPLVVVPLTMSMEILAEAAAALMPGQVLLGMRDIHAHQWIRVDDTPVYLHLSARRMANSNREVSVHIRILTDAPDPTSVAPVLEGIVVLGDSYPSPPKASQIALRAERISRLAFKTPYDGRRMFHGPCFQGVVSIDRSGENGIIGQLRTLPAGNLFRSIPEPKFVTDPVTLDAAGQLVGFWAAEYLERGFVAFPYQIEALRIYGPNRPARERLSCRANLQLNGNEGIRSDIEVATTDGSVWAQVQGWACRRFDSSPQFHRAWVAPREAMISEPWQAPVAGIPDKRAFECYRLERPFRPGIGLWKDLWASLVLTREERKAFKEIRGAERHQLEWLSGRTVAKDAVRSFLRTRHGLELLPADIEITHDEHGKPMARGPWTQHLRAVPELSLTHSEGMAAALVGDGSDGTRFGIDVQAIRDPKADFETFAFTIDEQGLLNAVPPSSRGEWLLRLWCVKEAVSKALGRGLIEGPRSVRILALDTGTGVVKATPNGKLAEAVRELSETGLLAWTTSEHGYVVATAIYQEGTS